MIASGLMPRSPVWLRKIPSTVSGSQGSRRGFAPAVRFAFPLGARLNTTLRARPCQELFSESFCRPSRGPRGAPPSGLLPFAAASSALYAPPGAPGAGNPPAHRMPTTPARRSGGDGGIGLALRPAPRPRRFAPAHRRGRPGGPALARLGPPGRSIRPRTFNYLYISRRIGARLRTGGLPRRRHASGASPCRRLSPVRFRQASRGGGSLPKEERPPPGPPAFRAGNPLGDRPWSILSIYL